MTYATLQMKPCLMLSPIEGEVIVYDKEQHLFYHLNHVIACVLRFCTGQYSEEQMAAPVANELHMDIKTTDVPGVIHECLKLLARAKLLVASDASMLAESPSANDNANLAFLGGFIPFLTSFGTLDSVSSVAPGR